MSFTIREEISTTPRQLFDHLHDPDLVKTWMPGLISMQMFSPDPRKPGAKFQYLIRQFGKRLTMEGELLEFIEPSRIAVRLTTKQFSFDVNYEIQRLPKGSKLIYTFALNPGSRLPGILTVPFELFMQKMASQQIESLRTTLRKPRVVNPGSPEPGDCDSV